MKDIRTFMVLNLLVFTALTTGLLALQVGWLKRDLAEIHQLITFRLEEVFDSPGKLTEEQFSQQVKELNLAFISSQLAVDNTIAAQGIPQHPMLERISPERSKLSVLQIGEYQVQYKPSYSRVMEYSLQRLYLELAIIITAYLLSFIACIITVGKIRRKLHAFVISEAKVPNQKPVLGSVGELIKDQKVKFVQQIHEQKQLIKQLESQVNVDPLTGHLNRHSFREKLTEICENDRGLSAVFLVRASQLQEINQLRGHFAGDEYIQDLGALIEQARDAFPEMSIYRLLGADFAIICQKVSPSLVADIADELKSNFSDYSAKKHLQSAAYIGITEVKPNDHIEKVVARTDSAVIVAQTLTPNSWQLMLDDIQEDKQGDEQWIQTIKELMIHKSFKLATQEIQSLHRSNPAYNEVFIRFVGKDQQILPTATTLLMAQRLEMEELEFAILDFTFAKLASLEDKGNRWGINLSRQALINSNLVQHIGKLIALYPNLQTKLVFELEEHQLESHLAAAQRLFEELRKLGCHTSIADFGAGIGSFKLFKLLKPNFIKVSNDLVSQITEDKASQQFVRLLTETSHRVGCRVIAQAVETLEQKQVLENMYVDGLQGYLVAKPQLL